MTSGLAELGTCLASLNALLARAKGLVLEYDRKIRKNPHSQTEDIARLKNSISFVELGSLDQICSDALARWLPERPELAKEWFVNETKGFGSPEDVVTELERKRVRLTFAIDLYRTLADDRHQSEASDVPRPYKKLGESMQRFFSDVGNGCDAYDRNVFIMTRFQSGNKELMLLDAAIRQSLRANGLRGHRADDRCYPSDRNLWDNVCTYMFGCKYGIAVLEDLVVAEFNPNVALEYGFMRALGKPTLLLKEKRFNARADILGTVWEELNIFDIEATVKSSIDRWWHDIA